MKRFSEKMRVKTKTESVRSESEKSRHALVRFRGAFLNADAIQMTNARPACDASFNCQMKAISHEHVPA
ncbi:hypothetical protein DKP76_08135 [Falsochrobactrum shanghaiense]|uniref:Uncharacterized protein n=1 Tax=Falsochrobactrum shanghaiense TaxID=2201899 RepID=A0A316J742_9HYPH|nr:hypothetical protein DKP76_08135 [Falsochrobactrum shanghaiense]